LQGDKNACNAWLAAILFAIAVEVVPDIVAQRSQLEVTCIPGIVGFAGGQDGVDCHARRRVHVAVECVVATQVGGAHRIARRSREGQFVSARFEAGEVVTTRPVGGRGQVNGCAVTRGAGQHDRHAGDARFACVLCTVTVKVVPHEVADGCGLEVAGIPGQVAFTAFEHGVDGHARHFVHIAVGRVGAAVNGGGAVSRWFREGQFVSSRFKVREQIKSVRVGGGAQIHYIAIAGGTGELDRYVANTRFARILNTVAVEVMPYEVADFGQFEETCIPGIVGFARSQHRSYGHTRRRVYIAVECVVAALIGGCYGVSGRCGKGQFISAGFEAGKRVFAVRAGGGAHINRCTVAGRTGQHDRHAGDARFANILFAVAVFVIPHEVADRSRLEEACVHRQVVVA